jgi:hypothetical protein
MVDLVGSARTVIQKTKILSATIIKPTMVWISTIKAKIKWLDKQ